MDLLTPILVLLIFIVAAWSHRALTRRLALAEDRMNEISEALTDNPYNESLWNEFSQICSDSNEFLPEAYEFALRLVEQTRGSAIVKRYALDLGRMRYSYVRPDRSPTIYDEQAIQNDINARC